MLAIAIQCSFSENFDIETLEYMSWNGDLVHEI